MPGNTDLEHYRQRMQAAAEAEKYAHRFEKGARRRINLREQRAVELILAGLGKIDFILDIPAGAGRFLDVLSRHCRRLIESDVALEILLHARQKAVEANLATDVVQGNASRLPLTDQAVDLIFCNRLLHHLLQRPERASVLREFHRVSRRHVLVSFFDYRKWLISRSILKMLKRRSPTYHKQPSLTEFGEEVVSCGFRIAKVHALGPTWVAEKYILLERVA
jgi:ubiquinone/menaquinone biosynthesis C-methylase UbiE